jgi:hypothetical protein
VHAGAVGEGVARRLIPEPGDGDGLYLSPSEGEPVAQPARARPRIDTRPIATSPSHQLTFVSRPKQPGRDRQLRWPRHRGVTQRTELDGVGGCGCLAAEAGATPPPIALGRAPACRPRRARRQRSTRARYVTNAAVVYLAHAGVSASLTASVSPTAAPLPAQPWPAWFAYGAEHVPSIRAHERQGRRPGVGSRSGKRPGKGILGRVGLEQAPVPTAVVP